nr:uncharacterized protein LOC128691338 isoform X1 [Cherax quadricarinatus]
MTLWHITTAVRIPAKVTPEALQPLPKTQKFVEVVLSGVSDAGVSHACDVVHKLQPPKGVHSTWGKSCWCPRVRRRQYSVTGQDFWQATFLIWYCRWGCHFRRAWSESWQRRLSKTSGSHSIIHRTEVSGLAVKVASSFCRLLTEAVT